MIIEYLDESVNILAEKVDNEEITLESAIDAYNDIADKAINEYANEVLDAVDDGVLTATEACLILELCGIVDAELVVTEADYDLSGLSNREKKQIQDKLASMPEKQRKKAEAVLAKQFPSEEYKAKIEKRKKIAAGVGLAAGTALAAGAAYGAHKINQAEKVARSTDKAYKAADEKRDARLADLNSTNLYGQALSGNKKAQKQLDAMRPKDQRKVANDYASKATEIHADNAAETKEIRDKKIARQGKIGYIKNILKTDKAIRKLDKDTRNRILQNKADEEDERQWANSRKGKTLGIKIGNLFRKKEDKLYDPGITKKGIDKKLNEDYGQQNKEIIDKAEKEKENMYKKNKK